MYVYIYTHTRILMYIIGSAGGRKRLGRMPAASERPALSKQIGRQSWNSRCSHSSDDGGSPSGNALQQSPPRPTGVSPKPQPRSRTDQLG